MKKRIVVSLILWLGLPMVASALTCPAPIANAPVVATSCYPLQETTGTTITDTIDSNSGTISGTYTLNTGGGIACNGISTGCNITTPTSYPSPQPMSIVVAFSGTGGGILQLGSSSAQAPTSTYYTLYLNNLGQLTFGANNYGTLNVLSSPHVYTDGNPHIAMVTIGNLGMKMYVDGGLVAQRSALLANYAAGYWFFGGVNTANWPLSPSQTNFNGTLTYIAWWNGTQLSDAQAETITFGSIPTPSGSALTPNTITGTGSNPTITNFAFTQGNVNSSTVNGVIPPTQYGALCNNSTDDSTAFSNTIAAAENSITAGTALGIVQVPAGVICKINSTLTLDLSKMALDLNGSTLNFSGLSSSSSALKLTASDALVNSTTPNVHGWIKNGKILAPGGTSICLDVGNPTPTSYLDLEQITSNLTLFNCGTGVKLGNGVFGVDFDTLYIANPALGIYGPNGVTNAGERIVFTNATIANPTTGCIDYENVDGELHFDNSSCDNFNTGTYQIKNVGSRVFATNSHWEGMYAGTENPIQVSGNGALTRLNGGMLIIHGTAPTDYIENTATAGFLGVVLDGLYMSSDNTGPTVFAGGSNAAGTRAFDLSGSNPSNLSGTLLYSGGPYLLDRNAAVNNYCGGLVTLSGGAGTFTNYCVQANSKCTATVQGAAHAVGLGAPTAGSITVTGTGTDSVQVVCQ